MGQTRFREDYGRLRTLQANGARETAAIPEYVVQCVWYDQLFRDDALTLDDGRRLRVLSPGWWNHGEGPDFIGAQLEINGRAVSGDIEVHLRHADWRQHGHHLDERYTDVSLIAVLEPEPPRERLWTSDGRPLPCLLLPRYIEEDLAELARRLPVDDYAFSGEMAQGRCAAVTESHGTGPVVRLLTLAGEWRLLNKSRVLRDRMDRAGEDQAVYEAFMTACGFSRYKHQFRLIAQQLPYERVVQLVKRDPLLVETAFLQLAGLLPEALPGRTADVPHFNRLRALRRDRLPGLRCLSLSWKRTGVRPNNYPERRLAGAARFLARCAKPGFAAVLGEIWRSDAKPAHRRRAFEQLFPRPMGFWAEHCSWTGQRLPRPAAPIGPSRVRSIIGNVFIPAGLAVARGKRDRILEQRVFELFAALPKEADNHVLKRMVPRVFGDVKPPRITFRLQQGLLQLYQDWCQSNPSCQGCSILAFLEPSMEGGDGGPRQ